MNSKVKQNREILRADNREKVWEEFPDTFGEQFVRVFQILENYFSES